MVHNITNITQSTVKKISIYEMNTIDTTTLNCISCQYSTVKFKFSNYANTARTFPNYEINSVFHSLLCMLTAGDLELRTNSD